ARGKGISVPIDAGIMPVLDASRVKKMVSMSNAKIPGPLQKIIDLYEDDSVSMYKAGIEYAVRQIHDITVKTESSVHLYVMNNSQSAKDIISSL
ncbi:MAG TPA: methylenetetrahydrofolate reductase, partial [Treponemataceae bacterium]|nr:methylenetetrahydrofolate reductase [Treponemataceae bacterium]